MKKLKKMLSIFLSLCMLFSTTAGVDFSTYAASVKQVTSLSYSELTTTSVKLKWKKVSGAAGYYVYRYTKSNNKYKRIAAVKSTSYNVKKLKAGTTYRYTVKAYKKKGKKVTAGKMSKKLTLSTKPSKVKGLTSRVYDTKSVTLTWSKVKNATGYEVYKYDTKKKKYTKAATVKTNKAKISSLSSGKSYKFKVRAYRSVEKKKYFGAYSSVLTKSTLKNIDVKSKLVNGYLYEPDIFSPDLYEYIFYSDGTFIKNIYDAYYCENSNEGNGRFAGNMYGTYRVKNGVIYYSYNDSSDYVDKLYYDGNCFRTYLYEMPGDSLAYTRYAYRNDRVKKSERVKYKENIIKNCGMIFV